MISAYEKRRIVDEETSIRLAKEEAERRERIAKRIRERPDIVAYGIANIIREVEKSILKATESPVVISIRSDDYEVEELASQEIRKCGYTVSRSSVYKNDEEYDADGNCRDADTRSRYIVYTVSF